MAKKTPKTETSTIETVAPQQETKQVAAVNVDSKNESSKSNKKSAKKTAEKKPNIFKRMAKGIKGTFPNSKSDVAQRKGRWKEHGSRSCRGRAFLRYSFCD